MLLFNHVYVMIHAWTGDEVKKYAAFYQMQTFTFCPGLLLLFIDFVAKCILEAVCIDFFLSFAC